MSLASNVDDLATRVATEIKAVKTTASGKLAYRGTVTALNGQTLAVNDVYVHDVGVWKVVRVRIAHAVSSAAIDWSKVDWLSGEELATETVKGIVELATTAEATTGTDTTRAVTPAGVKAVADTKIPAFADPGIDSLVFWDDSAGAFVALTPSTGIIITDTTMTIRGASDTQQGIIERATASETLAGTDGTRAVTPSGFRTAVISGLAPTTLTDAATIATDAALNKNFRVTITADRTLGAPTNPTDGQMVLWEVTASGANRTLTLATGASGAFKFGTDITAIPTIVSGTTTYIGAKYNSAAARWHVLSVASGY